MKTASSNLTIALVVTLICAQSLAAASLIRTTPAAAPAGRQAQNFMSSNFTLPLEPEDIGIRIVLQAWNPLNPDQNLDQTLLEPALVSDSLQSAWSIARERICRELKTKMGVGGFAMGQTLSNIDCVLDERVAFKITNTSQNVLHGVFAVGGYLAVTSTTPDGIPAGLDPRLSIALKANMDLTVAIQPNPDQTLQVSSAKFTLSEATLDSHNLSADIVKFVVDDLIPFFSGPNYKSMAENAINSLSLDLARDFNEAIKPVNLKLKPASDAVRVGLSFSSNLINVAFAPRGIPPPTNGRMTGQLRWNPNQFTPGNGCQSFDIRAVVQVGPVPKFVVDANAPTRQVGTFQISAVDAHTCSFTLSGLAGGWPHVLTPRIIGASAATGTGSSIHNVSYTLVGDGWNGRTVVPQPVASNLNYKVSYSFGASAIKDPDISSRAAQVEARTSKVINPADTNRASDSSLNPQPLPPRKESTRVTRNEPGVGTQSGIIIVGGRHPTIEQRSRSNESTGGSDQSGGRFDAYANRGAVLVNEDSAAADLRNQLPDGPAQRGFNIGMAVAEGQTLPGPGKDRIRDSLPRDEQDGFTAAVSYSMEKNRNQFTGFASRGSEIAAQVPLAAELRNQFEEGPARRGFDIGLAVAEHDTAPGPGKQKIRDLLYPDERAGFSTAVEFSLERNRYIELATIGASIAQRDPSVASARNAIGDVFYRLGFDIATGLYGSPAMGSKGNTAIGPGGLRIRDALSTRAQSGFNDSVKLHLSRKY